MAGTFDSAMRKYASNGGADWFILRGDNASDLSRQEPRDQSSKLVTPANGLPESYIRGTVCQAPAGQDRGQAEQPMMHGLGARRPVSAGGTAGPPAQPGDDPRVPREQTFIMRIPEFLGAPFQAGIERAQRRHVGRISGIGDRLTGASVSGHHKLHRSYGSDQ